LTHVSAAAAAAVVDGGGVGKLFFLKLSLAFLFGVSYY